MRTLTIFAAVIVCASLAHGQARYVERAPSSGPWKDQPPGTFVVTKQTMVDEKGAARSEFAREVLLGIDAEQNPWFAVSKSNAPAGPWAHAFGHGGGTTYANDPRTKTTTLGERLLTIGRQLLRCNVSGFEMIDDASIHTGEIWTDATSGLELQQSRTTKPRDADARPYESVWQVKTTSIEQRTLAGRTLNAFVQESSETTNGVVARTSRLVISADVPGRRISSSTWRGANVSAPAEIQTELIAWGVDPDALAVEKKRSQPSGRSPADKLATFHKDALDESESVDPNVRAHGLSTIGMNQFPPEHRERLERVVREGLAHADSSVRRSAAEAAGFQQLPGTAARIAELSNDDPAGAPKYIRALGRLADPIGLDVVLAAAKASNAMSVDYAVEGLVNFEDDRATAALREMIASPDVHVRSRVVRNLGRAKNSHAMELLLAASNDRDKSVRRAVMSAFTEKPDARAFACAHQMMNDPDADVRFSAVLAVARLGEVTDPKRGAEALFPLIDERTDANSRAVAMISLARMNDARVLPMLRTLAHAPPEKPSESLLPMPDSATAIYALTLMDSPESTSILIDLLRDPQRAPLVVSAFRNSKSPSIARVAWQAYRAIAPSTKPATNPSTAPSTRSQPNLEARDGMNRRFELLGTVIAKGDRALRDEVEASIAKSPAAERPELRRAVRQLDERLSATAQPPSTLPSTLPAR